MIGAQRTLQFVSAAGFTALGLAAVLRWRRHRDAPHAALALSLGALGLVAADGELQRFAGRRVEVLDDLNLVGFVLSGYAMLLVRHAFIPLRSRTRRLALGLAAAAAIAGVLVAFPDEPPESGFTRLQFATIVLIIGTWVAFVGEPAVRLWRAARGRPAVQRARLRSLAAGYGAIALVLLAAVAAVPAGRSPGLSIAFQAVVVAMIPVLSASFSPPAWVRRMWRASEEDALRAALARLVTLPDRASIVEDALRWAVRLLGGEGGVVVDGRGAMVAARGVSPARAAALAAVAVRGPSGIRESEWGGSVAVVPLDLAGGAGRMALAAGPFTPMFGGEEVERLFSYAAVVGAALDRAHLGEIARREQERTETLVQGLSDLGEGVVVASEHGITYANDAFCALTGYSRDEMLALPGPTSLVVPEDRERVAGIIRRRLAGLGGPQRYETTIERRDGTRVTVEIAAQPTRDDGTGTRGIAIIRDVTERHRADEALRASEARYRSIYENAPNIIMMFDRDATITSINHVVPGLRREDVIGQSALDFVAVDERERFMGFLRHVFERAEPVSYEMRGYGPQGAEVWYRSTMGPMFDGGRVVAATLITIDVSDSKRVEEALRSSEERIRLVVETANDAFVGIDERGVVTDWNRKAEETFGWPAQDAIGRSLAGLVIPPALRDAHRRGLDRFVRTGEGSVIGRRLEVTALHRDGREFPVELAVWPVRSAQSVRFFAFVHDISERKRAEARDRRRTEQLATLARVAGDLAGRLETDSLLPAIGDSAREVIGCRYAAIGVLGADGSLERFIPSGMEERHIEAIGRWPVGDGLLGALIAEARTIRVDDIAADPRACGFPPGHPMMRSFLGVPIRRAGRTTGLLYLAEKLDAPAFDEVDEAVATNLAAFAAEAIEVARAFEREHEIVARLRAIDEMKDSFLAAVSHELRTPLTSVLGFSETLRDTGEEMPPELRRDILDRIAVNAGKLERLLSDLLDLDRLNRGILEPRLRATDVAALVRGVVEQSELARERPVLVVAEPLTAVVDGPKVERIVDNLLANARRHTPAGTPVWVSVSPSEGGVLLAVEDAGPGIPSELREGIFEPFRQGPTVAVHSPGVGIGLSLVGRFAALHGGRAWVEERAGGGSSFRVWLPGAAVRGASGVA